MISEDIVTILEPAGYGGFFNYLPARGMFSCSSNTKNGFTHVGEHILCREIFLDYFRSNIRYIVFSKIALNIARINQFFEFIEKRLNVQTPTVFYSSNRKNSVLIQVSPFWTDTAFKRAMFTLFLRCGACYYDGEDIYQALLNYPLTKKIIGPIEYFMKGNTNLLKRSNISFTVETLSNFGRADWEKYLTKD